VSVADLMVVAGGVPPGYGLLSRQQNQQAPECTAMEPFPQSGSEEKHALVHAIGSAAHKLWARKAQRMTMEEEAFICIGELSSLLVRFVLTGSTVRLLGIDSPSGTPLYTRGLLEFRCFSASW